MPLNKQMTKSDNAMLEKFTLQIPQKNNSLVKPRQLLKFTKVVVLMLMKRHLLMAKLLRANKKVLMVLHQ